MITVSKTIFLRYVNGLGNKSIYLLYINFTLNNQLKKYNENKCLIRIKYERNAAFFKNKLFKWNLFYETRWNVMKYNNILITDKRYSYNKLKLVIK